MREVLSGIVASCQLHRFEKLPEAKPGLLIRPMEEWTASMVVGSSAKLVLPNGKEYRAKITGFEFRSMIPKEIPVALLIEELPELDNAVPPGTKVYVVEKE